MTAARAITASAVLPWNLNHFFSKIHLSLMSCAYSLSQGEPLIRHQMMNSIIVIVIIYLHSVGFILIVFNHISVIIVIIITLSWVLGFRTRSSSNEYLLCDI